MIPLLKPAVILFTLQAKSLTGSSLIWYYGASKDHFTELPEVHGQRDIEVSRTGYYKFSASNSFCNGESKIKYIEFIAGDSIWIPNVFTPNGDDKNPVFTILTTYEKFRLGIYNRYGKPVFETDQSNPVWTGNDFPSGAYFWYVVYRDCENNERSKKGIVHLLR